MTSIKHPLIDSARRDMSRERAPANRRKTSIHPSNRAPGHHLASTPVRNPTQVERIAVRYAPQPPQSERNVRIKPPRSRKLLIVNRKIKAQTA